MGNVSKETTTKDPINHVYVSITDWINRITTIPDSKKKFKTEIWKIEESK